MLFTTELIYHFRISLFTLKKGGLFKCKLFVFAPRRQRGVDGVATPYEVVKYEKRFAYDIQSINHFPRSAIVRLLGDFPRFLSDS